MKSLVPLLTFICSATIVAEVGAQIKGAGNPADKNFPNTLQPVNPVKHYGPRKEKKKKKSVTYDAKNEYNDRMEKTWREREKREKTLERGEAFDIMKPPYFGHKRIPKRHPSLKIRYCRECGIRH